MKTEAATENVENFEDGGIRKGPAFIKICQWKTGQEQLLIFSPIDLLYIYSWGPSKILVDGLNDRFKWFSVIQQS